jgi:RimJ/RimL family protein N-acetyltransferase
MPVAPELLTERLVLRPIAPSDAPSLFRLLNDPAVGRYLCDGEAVPEAMVEAILSRSAADFARDGFGLFGLRERAADPGAGLVGLCGFRIPVPGPVSPHGWEHPELLFALEPRLWNRGLTVEAGGGTLSYAFSTLSRPKITAAANPENAASWRVLERLGFVRAGLFPTPLEDLYTYELTRSAFLSTREACPKP